MDCLKSLNLCVSLLLFPGQLTASSYGVDTYSSVIECPSDNLDGVSKAMKVHKNTLKLLYIPFNGSIDSKRLGKCFDSPSYIPALLAVANNNQGNIFCIHFHGNACDVGQVGVCASRESYSLNAHYLVVEYPGYGISSGLPSEELYDEVAFIAYKFVINELKVPPSKVVLIGRSIGTGIAVKLAAKLQQLNKPVAALILQSAYSSIKAVAFDLVGSYLPLFMVDRWESYKYLVGNYTNEAETVPIIKAPVLFIHADNDMIIDVEQSISLHKARLREGLISELHIQKSTASFVKGHNHFEYDLDVIIPSRNFLGKYVAYQGLWGISGSSIDKYRAIPPVYSEEKMVSVTNKQNKNHKLYNICSCVRCVMCPHAFCIEGCVAVTNECVTGASDCILGSKKKYIYQSKVARSQKSALSSWPLLFSWNKRKDMDKTAHSTVENPIIHGEEDKSSINYLPG